VFHADFCFPIKVSDLFDQRIDGGLGVEDVTGRHDDNIAGPTDGNSALTFGNINTNSIHNRYSFEMY
jgi:hypothetical protein